VESIVVEKRERERRRPWTRTPKRFVEAPKPRVVLVLFLPSGTELRRVFRNLYDWSVVNILLDPQMVRDYVIPEGRPKGCGLVNRTFDKVTYSASSSFPSLESPYLRLDQERCNQGLDMIESLLTTMWGGCCSPDLSPGPPETARCYQAAESGSGCKTKTTWRQANQPISIPQPPEIRRLALDDERLCPTSGVDRSGSLSFLFYQDYR
jgi:hypothetical protein